MSGHSKWSSIKHQKGAADAKRGRLFTKLAHAVTVAARAGGQDPNMNPRLDLAMEMAKKSNMPKENIARAIKRGTGELGGATVEEISYEGYGPGGSAIYVETVTDNRNRTTADVRSAFTKHGGKMGESGSVAYLFRQRGVVVANIGDKSVDQMELAIIDSGAENYQSAGDDFVVYTDPKNLQTTKEALEKSGLTIVSAQLSFEPIQSLTITDQKTAQLIGRLIEALEELDDVSQVSSNVDIDETILAQID